MLTPSTSNDLCSISSVTCNPIHLRGVAQCYKVRFWDDGFGPLWLYRDASGLMGVVRAQTWHDAYDCVLDEILQPIAESETPEAYGFTTMEELQSANDPELIEGYQYQSNATGTGIVSIDLNGEKLEPLTHHLVKELGLMFRWS